MFDRIVSYLIQRVKDRFTGKVVLTFDKGALVEVRREQKEALSEFVT